MIRVDWTKVVQNNPNFVKLENNRAYFNINQSLINEIIYCGSVVSANDANGNITYNQLKLEKDSNNRYFHQLTAESAAMMKQTLNLIKSHMNKIAASDPYACLYNLERQPISFYEIDQKLQAFSQIISNPQTRIIADAKFFAQYLELTEYCKDLNMIVYGNQSDIYKNSIRQLQANIAEQQKIIHEYNNPTIYYKVRHTTNTSYDKVTLQSSTHTNTNKFIDQEKTDKHKIPKWKADNAAIEIQKLQLQIDNFKAIINTFGNDFNPQIEIPKYLGSMNPNLNRANTIQQIPSNTLTNHAVQQQVQTNNAGYSAANLNQLHNNNRPVGNFGIEGNLCTKEKSIAFRMSIKDAEDKKHTFSKPTPQVKINIVCENKEDAEKLIKYHREFIRTTERSDYDYNECKYPVCLYKRNGINHAFKLEDANIYYVNDKGGLSRMESKIKLTELNKDNSYEKLQETVKESDRILTINVNYHSDGKHKPFEYHKFTKLGAVENVIDNL